MATRDTRSSSSRFSEARAGDQARVEDAAHVGGMAGAFSRAFAMAPQVLALQQAVLAGMVQSQQREAERLAERHGIDDERVGAALERAARFDELGAAAASGGEVAGRLAQTFQQEGLFHGYVTDGEGTAAEGYTVRLQVQGGAGGKGAALRGSAKTDAEGYFRIELGAAGRAARPEAELLTRWLQSMAEDAPQEEPAAPADAAAAPAAQAQAVVESSVQVLAPNGRVVFEDPSPPTFEEMASEFRYYVLTEADGGRTTKRGAGGPG
jgi:hypothetical protein